MRPMERFQQKGFKVQYHTDIVLLVYVHCARIAESVIKNVYFLKTSKNILVKEFFQTK